MSDVVFAVLTERECRALLRRNHVGRVAFIKEGRVDIVPVHYALGGDWLYIRSAEGAKLEAFAHNPYVAFEVDEVDSPVDWRSVVAHGTVYWLEQNPVTLDRAAFERALRALRSFNPEAFTEDDPTPLRHTVYGIHIGEVSGRMAKRRPRSPKKKRKGSR